MNVGERAHLNAWKAAIGTATGHPVYEDDDDAFLSPDAMPPMYTIVAVTRISAPGNPRGTGERAVAGWRLVTTFVGTVNREVLFLLERFSAAHEDRQLAVLDTTPLDLETPADPPDVGTVTKRRQTDVYWSYAT